MPLEIDGVHYFSAAEVGREAGISRQTLWRWRQQGLIPRGHRFRSRQVVFTAAELAAVREYALRVEPIGTGDEVQLRLFQARSRGGSL